MTMRRTPTRPLATFGLVLLTLSSAACSTISDQRHTRMLDEASLPESGPVDAVLDTSADDAHPTNVRSQSPYESPMGYCPPSYGQPGFVSPPPDALPPGITSHCPPGALRISAGLENPLAASPALHPDEYLLDGGDRDHPVHYDSFNRLGLDTEDTVAEFVDEDGGFHAQPTNRVAVYAPRFAAVRVVDMPGLEELVQQPGLSNQRRGGVTLNTRLVMTSHAKYDPAIALRMRSRASEVDVDARAAQVDQAARLAAHEKLINLGENITFLRTGVIEQEDRPLLAERIQAATVWNGDVAPMAYVKLDNVHEVKVEFIPAQLIGKDESALKPADLRIVKLADKDHAVRGELVTFTIRYDNVGDAPLHHLKIVDNLTPRLEYVEDSADSDREGRLVVQDNGEGSLVLVFEVAEPIDGGTGGIVSFQARVR